MDDTRQPTKPLELKVLTPTKAPISFKLRYS